MSGCIYAVLRKRKMLISAEVLSFMLLRKQGDRVSEVKGFLNTEMKNQEKDEIIKQGNRKQILHYSCKKGGMPLAMGMAELHPLCPLHSSCSQTWFKCLSRDPMAQMHSPHPSWVTKKSQDYRQDNKSKQKYVIPAFPVKWCFWDRNLQKMTEKHYLVNGCIMCNASLNLPLPFSSF